MLYQIGPLTCDTFPFSVDEASRETSADYAKHDLIGAARGYEFGGPGDDLLNVSGQLLPFHIGGLSEVELAHQLAKAGNPLFCMRGDGRVQGWRVLTNVKEGHTEIAPNGVGFVVKYELKLEKVPDPSTDVAGDLIGLLLSLFG